MIAFSLQERHDLVVNHRHMHVTCVSKEVHIIRANTLPQWRCQQCMGDSGM
jgi:hypothetical protein